jgi:hypothetical protein
MVFSFILFLNISFLFLDPIVQKRAYFTILMMMIAPFSVV